MRAQHYFRVMFTFCVLLALCGADASAEIISRIPGDFGWRKSVPLHLILARDVVEDLGLKEETAQKLKQLHEQIQKEVAAEQSKATQSSPSTPRPDRWVRVSPWDDSTLHLVRKRHTDEMNELLTPQQQERLYEIHLRKQRKATDTLCDSEVAQKVGLTSAQRSEIIAKHREVVRAEMDKVKLGGKYTGPSSATLEDRCPEAVMKILTDEQRQAFEQLQGRSLKSTAK